jgi:hypothetical protein
MPTHNAKGAGGIGIVSRSRRGTEMGTVGSRRKWTGQEEDVPLWPAENRYPVATRVREFAESFGIQRGSTRFGTEGSEML